jgi:hypothetical protein
MILLVYQHDPSSNLDILLISCRYETYGGISTMYFGRSCKLEEESIDACKYTRRCIGDDLLPRVYLRSRRQSGQATLV